MSKELFESLTRAVVEGEEEEAVALVKQALEQGVDPLACINEGLMKGIEEVGERFSDGTYFLPELIMGADAMKAALEILEPKLVGGDRRAVVGTVVLGTVAGDQHEIGKTLVGTMLTANGFRVIDIGVDMKADDFVAAIEKSGANIVGASALLTTTLLELKRLIDSITEAGLREKVKVMIGGAPVTQDFADDIGADGYADDAIAAVEVARKLVDAAA
jgi:5-methyltetrahydrofolate--homocysteine methyltransferase